MFDSNDLIINNQAIRGLSEEGLDAVTDILDIYLAPNFWAADADGNRLFELSTSTQSGADLHILHGELETKIKQHIEKATGRKFAEITDRQELAEISETKSLRGREF